jgi:hypothetical protein
MLAGRLLQVVRDILAEYSSFKIVEQLSATANLSVNRGQLNPHQYNQQAQTLRAWAQTIIDQSKLAKYPDDLRKFLEESRYASALPEHIARLVLNGLPSDKDRAISSPELNIYIEFANILRGELTSFVVAADKFNIKQIAIRADELSLDVLVPRGAFSDRADGFIEILSKFAGIMSSLTELTKGSRDSPTLTYTSTTDPVTGLGVCFAVGCAFLHFYKLLLEVAEKQISLLKNVKDFRVLAPDASIDFEERVKSIVEDALKKAIDSAIAVVPSKVPDERVNEIKIALSKDARVAVQAIVNGARVGITIESLDKIADVSQEAPEFTTEKINEMLNELKRLEHRVTQSLDSLGDQERLLLRDKSGSDGSSG